MEVGGSKEALGESTLVNEESKQSSKSLCVDVKPAVTATYKKIKFREYLQAFSMQSLNLSFQAHFIPLWHFKSFAGGECSVQIKSSNCLDTKALFAYRC